MLYVCVLVSECVLLIGVWNNGENRLKTWGKLMILQVCDIKFVNAESQSSEWWFLTCLIIDRFHFKNTNSRSWTTFYRERWGHYYSNNKDVIIFKLSNMTLKYQFLRHLDAWICSKINFEPQSLFKCKIESNLKIYMYFKMKKKFNLQKVIWLHFDTEKQKKHLLFHGCHGNRWHSTIENDIEFAISL